MAHYLLDTGLENLINLDLILPLTVHRHPFQERNGYIICIQCKKEREYE